MSESKNETARREGTIIMILGFVFSIAAVACYALLPIRGPGDKLLGLFYWTVLPLGIVGVVGLVGGLLHRLGIVDLKHFEE